MQKQLPISVCMISGPEAGRIGRALASVAPWAGRNIVVLNEDVQDGTEEIARQHGAQVFREPWRGFAAQKNSAQAKASQPWVLGLDADEVVSPKLREEIIASSPKRRRSVPPTVSRAAAFTLAAGLAMAIGIPTAACGCGSAIEPTGWASNPTPP